MARIDKYEGIDNYQNLAISIILQAVRDYESGLKYQRNHTYKKLNGKMISMTSREARSAELFFYSPWFVELSNKIDGAALKRKLDMNFKKYGKCIMDENNLHDLLKASTTNEIDISGL